MELEKLKPKNCVEIKPEKWITNENYHECVENENTLITGIHQCGNLSSNSIREYCRNEKVTKLAIVGCCYNCLTERVSH